MNKNKIPTLIGVIVLTLGIATGVLLVKNQQIFRLGASPNKAPMDVRISNITDSSLTISWVTNESIEGFVKLGTSESNLDKTEVDTMGEPNFTHTLSFKGLAPQTPYFFKINSGGGDFDNNGVAWQASTGPTLPEPQANYIISGSVLEATGQPAKNALVFLTLAGSGLLSTTSSTNGTWLIPVSQARDKSLASYIQINPTSTLIEISVNAGPLGISTAQIYPQAAKPAPPVILGQVHDFKNLPPNQSGDLPQADVLVSENLASPSSGFNVDKITIPINQKAVTLDNLREGEVVTTSDPQFFGKGPAGTKITVTLESDNPVTQTVSVPTTGNWSWDPPKNLPVGSHKITIKWTDAAGILRTLTRNFVVSAAEGPAFVSTPSATPKNTPRPTASPSAYPDSGVSFPTILGIIFGMGILSFSAILWKKAES